MFEKIIPILEKEEDKSSEILSKLLEAHSIEVEEALAGRDLYDDHGSVIIGDRKKKPVFS